ncbi:hypothetical protein WAK64_13250 [Bacillus spongiae]|uniref:Uncharacterized protein n=1 Tax=Bacillus spongiae TaxID=2683610 RepID=A0ABU8HFR8_9BACI
MIWIILLTPFLLVLIYAGWHDWKGKKYSQQRAQNDNEDQAYVEAHIAINHNRHSSHYSNHSNPGSNDSGGQ